GQEGGDSAPASGGAATAPPCVRSRRRYNSPTVADFVFFYGTLMTPFNRPGRQRVDAQMTFTGRGHMRAALFDLGIYPAAVPATDDSMVWGEVYEMLDGPAVLAVLDEIEGYRAAEPESSLYTRILT